MLGYFFLGRKGVYSCIGNSNDDLCTSSTVKRTSRPCQGYHVDRADDAIFRLYVVDNKIIVSCSNEYLYVKLLRRDGYTVKSRVDDR